MTNCFAMVKSGASGSRPNKDIDQAEVSRSCSISWRVWWEVCSQCGSAVKKADEEWPCRRERPFVSGLFRLFWFEVVVRVVLASWVVSLEFRNGGRALLCVFLSASGLTVIKRRR